MKENTEKMLDMLAEACEIALGDEWHSMTEQQKHDTIMYFAKTALERLSA